MHRRCGDLMIQVLGTTTSEGVVFLGVLLLQFPLAPRHVSGYHHAVTCRVTWQNAWMRGWGEGVDGVGQ